MSRTRYLFLALLGLPLGGALSSCVETTRSLNPNHCANQNGDSWCVDRYPDGSLSFCNFSEPGCADPLPLDGCVAKRPLDDLCYSPCGGEVSYVDAPDCDGISGSTDAGEDDDSTDDDSTSGGTTDDPQTGTGSTDTGSSTTGPVMCGGPEDCVGSEAPYCSTEGVCVTCDEAPTAEEGNEVCAAADAMTPACTADGACVTCTETVTEVCDEQLLLCDAETNTCIPCVEHADCVSGACHIAEGTCFPNDVSVAHVDEDGGQDFASITAAIGAVADGDYGIVIVHETSGLAFEGFTVDGGKTVALFAEPGEDPIVQGTGGDPGLSITGAETAVYIEAVDFVGNTMDLGLVVDAGTAWVDRSRIVQNSGGGVLAQGGANLTLRNCFVGHGTGARHAVSIESGSDANIIYSTLVSGFDNFEDVYALQCTAPGAIIVRNSFLGTLDNVGVDILCDAATVSYSASQVAIAGMNNVDLPDIGAMWFDDINSGDLLLDAPPAALLTTAQWNDGDPRVDIDGDPRPEENGTPDVAGADVP